MVYADVPQFRVELLPLAGPDMGNHAFSLRQFADIGAGLAPAQRIDEALVGIYDQAMRLLRIQGG